MGWTGRYTTAPKSRRERIGMAIQQEGFNYANENMEMTVVDSSLRGTTVYLACYIRYKDDRPGEVIGAVILTSYGNGEFRTKAMTEDVGPCECGCPKRILDMLTPTEDEYAQGWRRRCREAAAAPKDPLATMPMGTRIRLRNPNQTELCLTKYKGRRTFMGTGTKASLRCVRSWGYDIVGKA